MDLLGEGRGNTRLGGGLASCRDPVPSGKLLTGGMMRAVWMVLVAGFRRQWRSWLLLGALVAVASGFVLASAAAGRRTDSAFPRYIASHGYGAIVNTVQPKLAGTGQMALGASPMRTAGARIGSMVRVNANALAAVPAMSAARSRPGSLLRTE